MGMPLRWIGFGTLILICASVPAFGQTTAKDDSGSKATGAAEKGILPVPDYSGDLSKRPYLTGDWGGTRQEWADKGFTFSLGWMQVGQGIVSGGIDEGWEYGSNLDYRINLDLMRMDVLPGAVISFRGQSRFGDSVNSNTGLLLPVNDYSAFPLTASPDEDVAIAITELNWLQFFSEEFGLLLGKITTLGNANEFSGGAGLSQFMNFQFTFSAAVAQTTPYSTLAAGGIWMPSSEVTVTTMFMNTKDASTTSGFGDIGDGTTWATTVDTKYELGGLPGGVTLGGIYAFDGDFDRIGGLNFAPGAGISVDSKSTAWAAFVSGWQYVHTEDAKAGAVDPRNGIQDLQGLGVFASLGFGDHDTNPVTWSVSLGLSGRGLIDGRDDDTCGIGYFYNSLQDSDDLLFRLLDSSTEGFEAYYNIALAPWAALTLDFQWTNSAVGSVDDATILGLRLDLKF